MLRILVVGLAVAYVAHRWVPRVRVTWPMVAVFCGSLLAIRALSQL